MSKNHLKLDENEVHYVYGDQQFQQFVLDQEEIYGELGDLICSDGSRAIIVDGQYIVTDNQALLLQEGDTNLTQYYINDDTDEFVIDEEVSANNLTENTEVVQLVEDDTNDVQQIIYYTDEDPTTEIFGMSQETTEDIDIEGIQDEDGNIYPFKRIKLEGQLLNFDDLDQEQVETFADVHHATEECQSVEYAVVENDGNYQKCSFTEESSSKRRNAADNQFIDLSKITGRNLITGQTVTLHSYMEKLKKKLKTSNDLPRKLSPIKSKANEPKKSEFADLLNRKIAIGKTKSGKKIVGKIIHVERKIGDKIPLDSDCVQEEDIEDNLVVINDTDDLLSSDQCVIQTKDLPEKSAIAASKSEDNAKILVKKCPVSKDSFDEISKTLGGVMEMETVRKKLENKNIVVKLVEKKYSSETDAFIRNTSYSYGYMERDEVVTGEAVEKWKFVSDQTTQDILLGDHFYSNDIDTHKNGSLEKTMKFAITTSLTIVISYGKMGNKTIRVNLNPAPGNLCTICAQYFKTNLQLRHHMNNIHNTYGNNTMCEVCEKCIDDPQQLQDHKNLHVQEGKLFICSKCNKCFTSQIRLQKHLSSHDVYLRPLECSVCEIRCASEWTLKKHLLTHVGIKPFSCDICQKQFLTQYDVNFHKKIHFPEKHFACNICFRTFSRHSNLLRHHEIHKGSGALYKCDICHCSYNYISSLTRHMVQNHIEAGDFRKRVVTET